VGCSNNDSVFYIFRDITYFQLRGHVTLNNPFGGNPSYALVLLGVNLHTKFFRLTQNAVEWKPHNAYVIPNMHFVNIRDAILL